MMQEDSQGSRRGCTVVDAQGLPGFAWWMLLQVPRMAQLPLNLVEWWVANYDFHVVQKSLGIAAPSWQQQLLEALLVVGVPWVPLLLQLVWQHVALRRTVHQQGYTMSQQAAASSSGSAKHTTPGADRSMQGAAAGTGGSKRPGRAGATAASASTAEAAQHAGLGCAPAQPSRSTTHVRAHGSSNSSSSSSQGPLATVVEGSSSGSALVEGSAGLEMPLGQGPNMDLLQQLLPGAGLQDMAQLEARALEGEPLMLEHLRYTPCCCMVPVSVKVRAGRCHCMLQVAAIKQVSSTCICTHP
jgi:hypothetical protein